MDIAKLAFLETYNLPDNGGIMGAVLVTDAETKPLEFRVTAPIKPKSFQKTLYGDVLLEHILVELIAITLLNALNEQVDMILVKDPLFLSTNNKQGIRVVRIVNNESNKAKGNTVLVSLNTPMNGNAKAYLKSAKKFEEELQSIKEKLEKIAESRNLSEPFERLKLACEQVQSKITGD